MIKRKLLGIFLCIAVATVEGCKTVDLDARNAPEAVHQTKKEHDQENIEDKKNEEQKKLVERMAGTVDVSKQIVYVQKPVYIPEQEKIPDKKIGDAVVQAVADNIVKPENYSGSAMVYDYDPDFVYQIYTEKGQTSDICLKLGETMIGKPVCTGDFKIGTSYNMENGLQRQHVYVAPSNEGLTATLFINTNERSYHILLKSYKTICMPLIRWNYSTGLPQTIPNQSADGTNTISLGTSSEYIDPKYLSFNYTMTYFRRPDWLPKNIYDDGKKTYIVMPKIVLQRQLPVCFENTKDILNYRVNGNVFVIDKLIKKITLKYKKENVTIRKKTGK